MPSLGRRPIERLGQRLRTLRHCLRLSMRELAALASVSLQMIARLEKNEAQPSLDVAGRLADALGVKVDELRDKER